MTSGKDNTPPADFDFNFDEFEDQHASGAAGAPHGRRPPESDFDLEFGEAGDAFGAMPPASPAPPRARTPAPAADDEFTDAIGVGEQEEFGGFGDPGAEGGHAREDHEYGEDGLEGALDGVETAAGDAPEDGGPRKKSLLSKLILPVGGLAMAGAVGSFVMTGFGDSGSAPAPSPQQGQAQPHLPPVLQPAQSPAPRLPDFGRAAAQAPVPAPGQAMAEAPVQPPVPGGGIHPPQAAPGMPLQAAEPAPDAAAKLEEKLDRRLLNLAAAIDGLARTVGGVHDEVDHARHEFSDRIAAEDGRIGSVDTHVAAVEQKEGGLEQRVAALEAARHPAAAPRHGAVPHTTGINRRFRRPAAAAPAPARQSAAPARSLDGYALRGVSRDAAMVETPAGLLRVELGKTIAGAGVAREIRREGDSWVLVTSGGVIRQ